MDTVKKSYVEAYLNLSCYLVIRVGKKYLSIRAPHRKRDLEISYYLSDLKTFDDAKRTCHPQRVIWKL